MDDAERERLERTFSSAIEYLQHSLKRDLPHTALSGFGVDLIVEGTYKGKRVVFFSPSDPDYVQNYQHRLADLRKA